MVKELIENSLDAGSSEVSIQVRGGGAEYIRVSDNGSGIPSDEVELAFERFATSKLSGALDLESISTLGFRGEALPSIAAVSRVALVTRTPSDEVGTRMEVADGQAVASRPEGSPPGTTVTVSQLFRNFPARRKFLRSPAAEATRVQSLVTRFALAYPEVRFELVVDGSTALSCAGSGELRQAIADVYSANVAEAMLELGQGQPPDGVDLPAPSGMIGPPSLTRANRNYMSIFVNGRWVQNRMLGYALQEAYRGFLMERRFPVAVVNINLPRHDVDVNVHPSKTEVRFRREGTVFSALQQAVRHTLTAHSPVPEATTSTGPVGAGAAPPVLRGHWPRAARQGQAQPSPNLASFAASAPQAAQDEIGLTGQPEPLVPRRALPALRVLGQSQSTYIAAEGPDGMYLIDQHAAHERVLFERVMAGAESRPPQVQGLMEAVTVEMDPRQSELAGSQEELIKSLGFQMESFGGRTYILRGVPAALSDGDPAQALLEVLDLMAEGGGFESWEERAAYSIACHGAIRAGKALSQQEMSELTRQLELCQQPHTCPHGRPTMIHLSSAHLEREFGRR